MAKVTILVNGLDGLDLVTELDKIIGELLFPMQRISHTVGIYDKYFWTWCYFHRMFLSETNDIIYLICR